MRRKSGCHCMHFYCGEMVAPVQVHCNGWAQWVHIIKWPLCLLTLSGCYYKVVVTGLLRVHYKVASLLLIIKWADCLF